jgi:HK97 family phage major capsid protein
MAYDSLINRTKAEALIPEEISREIIQEVPMQSAIMRTARRLPPISRQKLRMPVLSGLITAYFLDGDTGRKQTSELQWQNKFIEAAELAVLVPIPEAVLDDSEYDIWGEVRPRIVEAFGRAFDQAVMYGTNAPSLWPTNLLTAATAAGHAITLGSGSDIYEDIMGMDGVLAKVEEDGYLVTGHIAALQLRARLRGLRDTAGNPIFVYNAQAATAYELDGVPLDFPRNGSVDASQAMLISGDWNQLVYAMRQDITYKVLDQAVIQDNTGAIVYNLAQQDMVALRAVMRLGWQLPNPVNNVNTDSATRYPFSVLLPAG